MELEAYITQVANCIQSWLQPGNRDLTLAIEQTVDEKLFGFEDIRFQLMALKQTLQKKNLFIWARRSGLQFQPLQNRDIVCLHAGNLPLVGLQDALAVILTKGNYVGKISKKDPYLLPTFLKKMAESDVHTDLVWSSDIHQLSNHKANALLFAGTQNSAREVKSKLMELNIISPNTPALIRTAGYSIAFITDHHPHTMRDLTEAVFRYGGAGCRSVAIVVAPFHLDEEKCSFTDYVEEFWLKNPQYKKPPKSLFHRFAFNKAMGTGQAWLDDFLIEERLSHPVEKFVLQWVKGGKNELDSIVGKFKQGLQSVYSTKDFIGKQTGNFTIEPLSAAQIPPVWWKPDGVDTIEWLQQLKMNS